MVEIHGCTSLDVNTPYPRTCSDAEHFSGSIIPTSAGVR